MSDIIKCEYCETQLHPYHCDPITGVLYEGDEVAARNVHTIQRCRDILKANWERSRKNEGVGGYWHRQYQRVEDELDEVLDVSPKVKGERVEVGLMDIVENPTIHPSPNLTKYLAAMIDGYGNLCTNERGI